MDDYNIKSAYNVGQLIEILSEYEPDMRLYVNPCARDFGIDIRQSKDFFYTIEFGDEIDWQNEEDEVED